MGCTKLIAGKPMIIAFLLLSYASRSRTQSCYTPGGQTLADYGICHPERDTSLCCGVGDECFTNLLCQAADSTFYRGGCTGHAYADGCPIFCTSSTLFERQDFYVHEADMFDQAPFSTSLLVWLRPQVVRHIMLPHATIQTQFGTAAMAIKVELAAMIPKTLWVLAMQQLPSSQDPLSIVAHLLRQGTPCPQVRRQIQQRARPPVAQPRFYKLRSSRRQVQILRRVLHLLQLLRRPHLPQAPQPGPSPRSHSTPTILSSLVLQSVSQSQQFSSASDCSLVSGSGAALDKSHSSDNDNSGIKIQRSKSIAQRKASETAQRLQPLTRAIPRSSILTGKLQRPA